MLLLLEVPAMTMFCINMNLTQFWIYDVDKNVYFQTPIHHLYVVIKFKEMT